MILDEYVSIKDVSHQDDYFLNVGECVYH